MPYQEPTKGEVFRKRLGVYLVGVAIGSLAIGMYLSARTRSMQRQQNQRQAAPQQQPQQQPGPVAPPAE